MEATVNDLVNELANNDCAIMTCDGSEDFVRGVIAFWLYMNRHCMVYVLEDDTEKVSKADCNKKCALFVTGYQNSEWLKIDLLHAKTAFQLEYSEFLPKGKEKNLPYLLDEKNIFYKNIRLNKLGSPHVWDFWLMSSLISKAMVVNIPTNVGRNNLARYIELYNALVKTEKDYKSGELRKNVLNECAKNNIIDKFEILNNILKAETGLEMVMCPKGSFIMGSPENEVGRINEHKYGEEKHLVEIKEPFIIGRFPVVKSQYELILNNKSSSQSIYPVSASYEKAREFCEILNKEYSEFIPEGYKFDLPKESMWEYACRAGTITAFNNGKNMSSVGDKCEEIDEIAWYNGNSPNKFHCVGLKKPNSWGLFDMHGIINEWCINDQNRKDASGKEIFVAKGGSDEVGARQCRSAFYAMLNDLNKEYSDIGFRIALVHV